MLLLLGTSGLHAQARALRLEPVAPGQIRVDGDVGEWRGARFAELGDAQGSSLQYALGYDASALYVAARVHDDELVRSARPGTREDAIVLTLAMPRGGGRHVRSEVWLFAGEMGRSRASASVAAAGAKPARDAAIQVVEGPLEDGAGYVVEARVPWKSVAHGAEHQLGRGAIALHDVDGKVGARAHVVSSSKKRSARALPPLSVQGGANGALLDFLRDKGIPPTAVRHDLYGDVFGDGRLERVVLAGSFAVVVGPDIQGGGGFHYMDLPVMGAGDVVAAALRALRGTGKAQLTVRLKQQNGLGKREIFQVWALDTPQARRIFALELAKQTADGSVAARMTIGKPKGGKPPAIDVRIGEADGLGPDNFRDRSVSGVEPILLPWGPVARRVYRWDGSRFAIEREEDNADAHTPRSVQAAKPARPADDGAARIATHKKPPGMDQLVAAFRRAQGIPDADAPRFVRHVNVAEDARHESLMLFGAHLLVVGEGYRGGSGYFYFQLPVQDAADIQRLFTGDVTGDGRREVFVRHEQRIGDVQREILLGYTFGDDGGMQQILAVEVRRARGDDAIGNVVELVPQRGHWALRIEPGRARGWDRDSYPFVADAGDGYGALLLPWSDTTARYRYRDGRLTR